MMRRIMVNKIALDHRFTVGVFEYRLSKNLCRLQGRSSRQRNFDRIEVFNYAAVFTLIVPLITIQYFGIAHLFVQNVSAMCLINDDQVVVGDSRHAFSIVIENAPHHALHGCNLDTCFFVNALVVKPLDIVNFVKRHQIFQLDLLEYIRSLIAQRGSVYQEKYPLKPIGFQESVNHAQHSTGFSGSGSHGKQYCFPAVNDCLLSSLNRIQLVFAEI